MDFVMVWRMIYCLRNGLPLDQDVYDAAAWSAVAPLSEMSVNNRSRPVGRAGLYPRQMEKARAARHRFVSSRLE